MHVFLTGGTGYIGSAVARALLARGDSVTALVRSEQSRSRLLRGVTAVPGDLDHPTDWLRHLPDHDALIHTAFPQHGRAWGEAVEIEQRFLSLLLTSPDVSKMPVIVSNGSIFLGDSGTDRLNESAPIEDDHPAASRAQSVERIQALERGVELRLASFVYGNGGSVFIPILLNYARAHRRSLLVKGHEYIRTSALHVDAAAQAYLTILDQPTARGVFHVASEEDPTTLDIAQAVARAAGPGCSVSAVDLEEAQQELDPFTAMFLSTNNRLSALAIQSLGWSHRGFSSLVEDVAQGSYVGNDRSTFEKEG